MNQPELWNIDFNQKTLNALGSFPIRPELNFQIIHSEENKDYTLQTVEYFVEKNEKVKSYLLIPKKLKKKNPAILAIHQHRAERHIGKSEVVGKAGDPMYSYGLELCLRGYVVLAPDLLCFEERRHPKYLENREAHRAYERFEFCKYILSGNCLQTKYLHDLSVAIDVLENLTFVDKNKIGVIGHSLGGQEATWLMWYDNRIAAGVSSCGIGEMSSIINEAMLHNFAAYVPNFLHIGDMSDIVCNIAPRPFFITAGLQDGHHFPVDGVRVIITKAKDTYAKLGKSENFQSILFDDGHTFSDSVKKEVYARLDKQLA